MSEQNKQPGISLPHDEMIGHKPHVIDVNDVPTSDNIEVTVNQSEPMHGGYTGIRVGEMALRISRLQQQGNTEAANALIEQLEKVSSDPQTDK